MPGTYQQFTTVAAYNSWVRTLDWRYWGNWNTYSWANGSYDTPHFDKQYEDYSGKTSISIIKFRGMNEYFTQGERGLDMIINPMLAKGAHVVRARLWVGEPVHTLDSNFILEVWSYGNPVSYSKSTGYSGKYALAWLTFIAIVVICATAAWLAYELTPLGEKLLEIAGDVIPPIAEAISKNLMPFVFIVAGGVLGYLYLTQKKKEPQYG